ncbi:YjbF family lipoprotein [Luteimonas sp. TWI1416]|uniref:YjbF family lipoprotein n=1 Tax=unclassified Luteimonas TaxID=2629088 RepID=UPI003209637B
MTALRIEHRARACAASIAVGAVLLMLIGCNGMTRSGVDAVRLAVFRPSIEVTPERVAANPYAQVLVEGDDIQALMVLGNDDAGLTSWYSPDRRIVFLRDGLLAGTAGLPQDAVDIHLEGDNPFARLPLLEGTARTLRRYDWMPGHRYGVMVEGELRRTGTEQVEILGQTRTLVRFDERLRGPDIDAINSYWAEPDTGFILKSRQLLAPGRSLDLVQLKPYRHGSAR